MSKGLTAIQELELLSALESRGESPLKFAYIGDGYKNWTEIASKSRENHQIQFKEDLLKRESLPFIFHGIDRKIRTVNIVDFGCGDGIPMLPIFNYLKNISSISTFRYIPVDISKNMIEEAKSTVKKSFSRIEIVPVLFDFEKGEILETILKLGRRKNTSNYFFLLGNTLGNFHNTEGTLSNLKLSMFSNDHLIIGNQIANTIASHKWIEYYHSKEVFNLVVGTSKSYGMKLGFQEYNVRWNAQNKQIEMFLLLGEDKRIEIVGHVVKFEKNEEILLAVSKKFAEEAIVEVFNRVGFRIDLFTTNIQKDTCIISVTPTRYKS